MKKIFVFLLTVSVSVLAFAQQRMGDVNGDGVISMSDANLVVNKYLGNPVEGFNAAAADMNGDGIISIADANDIVNEFLSPTPPPRPAFTLGADISWYTELVDKGYSFYNGKERVTCPQLLADYGLTAARFRVWVNPANGYNGKDDVVTKAKAAADAGLDVLIDFHFSDTWADPGSQTVPQAWQGSTLTQLKSLLSAHVNDVLQALKAAGVKPRWVQVGNETNNGMLWDLGRASDNPANYAALVAEGCKAVKAVFPDALTIVHVSNAHDQGLFDWNIGILRTYNVPFDIIGMSLYPGNDSYTATLVDQAFSNIHHLATAFGKKVMIVETGVPVNSAEQGKNIIADIIARARQSNGECLGVLYWEPEAFSGWNYYQLGASTVRNKVISFNTIMDAFSLLRE